MPHTDEQEKDYHTTDAKRGVDYIGVTVSFICHDGQGKILLHKRSKNCRDEQGNWDGGGGAMEFGESFEDAVRREIKEEYCVDVLDLRYIDTRNIIRLQDNQKTHWVSILFTAQVNPELAKIGEPDKMDDFGWFSSEKLPGPMHSQFRFAFDCARKKGVL